MQLRSKKWKTLTPSTQTSTIRPCRQPAINQATQLADNIHQATLLADNHTATLLAVYTAQNNMNAQSAAADDMAQSQAADAQSAALDATWETRATL